MLVSTLDQDQKVKVLSPHQVSLGFTTSPDEALKIFILLSAPPLATTLEKNDNRK